MSPLLAREGVDKVISIYGKKKPPIWKKIARVEDTTEYFYRVVQEGDLGPAIAMSTTDPQSTGEAVGIPYDDYQTPYNKDYYPVKRGVGFAISTETLESDIYGVAKRYGMKMAKSMQYSMEADIAGFQNLATSSSFVGPDGQPLASVNHPLAAGVASNILNIPAGSASTNYLALTPLSLEQAVEEMVLQQSHRGQPMMYMGPYRLFVHPKLWGLADRIIKANGVQGTNTHDPNFAGGYVTEAVPDPYFTNETNWSIRSIADDEHGLVVVSRREEKTNMQYDIDKDVNKYTLTRIWVKGIEDWRGFIFSPS
jgi:hypothetical protein